MKLKYIIFFLIPMVTNAQNKNITYNGFVDVYWGFDSNRPPTNNRPNFLYNHTRHNEVSINLAFIKASFQKEKLRANLALGTGTYMQYNYAAEPNVLQNIFEANLGVKLAKNTWLDAGVLPSHIGFESGNSKDCWTLSRSLAAENSPYFETGIKLSNSPNEKSSLSLLYLNGWQRINRISGNSTPSFGTQFTFKFNEKNFVNWSSFIGSDKPDSLRKMRYFNNLYGILQPTSKFGITLGFDIGFEQKSRKSTNYNFWYTPVLIFRKNLNYKCKLALRTEYFADAGSVIIKTNKPNLKLFGVSLNTDYELFSDVLFRFEFKRLSSNQKIFQTNSSNLSSSFSTLSSLAISF